MTAERYNGWANYETWSVALLIDNDQGSSEYWRELAEAAAADAIEAADRWTGDTARDRAEYALAAVLKDWHEEQAPECYGQPTIYGQLLTAALGAVDWHEVASHMFDDDAFPAEAEGAT